MAQLDPRAMEKVSGPSWEALRDTFLAVSDTLLDVADDTTSQLTTIYVKYAIGSSASATVYAVAWIKSAKQFVVGLRLPPDFDAPLLGSPPKGMTYQGLTKYLTIKPGESIPEDFGNWAKEAYAMALSNST